ncbi:MAG: hypothetical protein RL607_1525 [Bacteroidota bacterium]
MDRIIAFLIICLLSPILFVLLVVTTIVFRCNPIFTQKRTVNGKSEFKFYKIRSMSKNAPIIPTNEFKDANVYINRWGRFLRRSSLDELLNLWNIVRGEMKFIGPRPIMICEVLLIEYRQRAGITDYPGITGLAQINGRDSIRLARKVACEKYYNRNKSVRLYFYILYRTAMIVYNKSGIIH